MKRVLLHCCKLTSCQCNTIETYISVTEEAWLVIRPKFPLPDTMRLCYRYPAVGNKPSHVATLVPHWLTQCFRDEWLVSRIRNNLTWWRNIMIGGVWMEPTSMVVHQRRLSKHSYARSYFVAPGPFQCFSILIADERTQPDLLRLPALSKDLRFRFERLRFSTGYQKKIWAFFRVWGSHVCDDHCWNTSAKVLLMYLPHLNELCVVHKMQHCIFKSALLCRFLAPSNIEIIKNTPENLPTHLNRLPTKLQQHTPTSKAFQVYQDVYSDPRALSRVHASVSRSGSFFCPI